MIYTEMTKKAMKIAFEAHKNQVDKSGLPYIYHPIHLAEQMDEEESVMVALLVLIISQVATPANITILEEGEIIKINPFPTDFYYT